uniref:Ig-like domain-containing protein n=1 Tax=Glossina austeni TaxID=7395 RepID=A0A1A9UXK2_GLOAU
MQSEVKPLEVKIIEPPSSMVADRRYEVTCESSGSRPNAIITWYKGKRQLRRTKFSSSAHLALDASICYREDEISNNTTRSELSFVPTTDDDGKSITCRAENPNVNGLYLETMWKLNVRITTLMLSFIADKLQYLLKKSNNNKSCPSVRLWNSGKLNLNTNGPKSNIVSEKCVHGMLDRNCKQQTGQKSIKLPKTSWLHYEFDCPLIITIVIGFIIHSHKNARLLEDPPLVTLRLGSTLSPDDIKEGDDVYFECHVQSNPQWRKLLWLHNGIHLEHNTSARVIRSNQSLVLQKITKHYAGNYACSAINDEGETVSNQLPLRVKCGNFISTAR